MKDSNSGLMMMLNCRVWVKEKVSAGGPESMQPREEKAQLHGLAS